VTIVLRRAGAADAPAAAELLLASRAVHLPWLPVVHPPDDVRHWMATVLVPTRAVTLAEEAGGLRGLIATVDDGRVRWIEQLFVAPGHTGRGIGARLLAHAHATLAPPIRLYTFEANRGAQRFYERQGYVVIARGDGSGNEEGLPDLLYERA
jgi:GNAT superfamily N-acetyltransferase